MILISSVGEIKTLEQLDREEVDHYELLVEALDQGTPRRSSQTLVKIIVDDVNDEAPKIEVPLNRMIYVPKSGSSLSIGTIIASDKDEKEVLSYQITSHNEAFSIDKWTGEIKLNSRDYINNAQNMTVTVRISDSARPEPNYIEEDIAIFFVDDSANELLSIITYNIKVDKNAYIGALVGQLSALVSSRREKFLYKIDKNDKFYVDGQNGNIYLIGNLNETTQDSFEFDAFIESVSGGTAPLHARVVFELSDESTGKFLRPKFSEDPIKIQVAENTDLGQIIHTLKPTNVDREDLIYAVLDQVSSFYTHF